MIRQKKYFTTNATIDELFASDFGRKGIDRSGSSDLREWKYNSVLKAFVS